MNLQTGRYLVFTSADIQITHWLQRKFEPIYVLAMRVVNNRFVAITGRMTSPKSRD